MKIKPRMSISKNGQNDVNDENALVLKELKSVNTIEIECP